MVRNASKITPQSPRFGERASFAGKDTMPLTILELRTAASLLRQARVLVESVKDFFRGYDADATARLGDIATRLNDEREYVEPLIGKAPNGSGRNS
jgi:hypothetical protein